MPSLRRRLEHSPAAAGALARLAGSYLWLCNRTIRWEVEGLEELKADLAEGPVLLVMWHCRLLMAPYHWPLSSGQLTSLYARSPVGRVAGALHRQMGYTPMEMSDHSSNIAQSRAILKRVKEGASIGLTADGPTGPAFEVKDAPLEWARVMQRPVWCYSFETSRGRQLDSWDDMWLPKPFGSGRAVFRRWDAEVPRKVDAGALEGLRDGLKARLDGLLR